MTVGVPTFCAGRLTEARLARGLYKKSLGDLIGVSGTAIARYEDGSDKPQPEKLEALAEKLNFPITFFQKAEWSETLQPFFWRSQAAETKYAREMTEQRAKWACEFFSLLDEEVVFPSLVLPDLDLPNDVRALTSEHIEAAAFQLRSVWGLRDRPIPDVTLALENAGIPVIQLEIPSEKQDGFCFRSMRLRRVFAGVNVSDVSAARARYDVAHELGHAVLHSAVTADEARDRQLNKLIEQQAHRFAGAFLFPNTAFVSEVRVPSLDYFCNLKKKWGMSIAAMIYRAFHLGLIDAEERKTLYQNMTRRGWRGSMREPFDDPAQMAIERPRMLKRAVDAVISNGLYTRSSLLAAMALPNTEVEQIAGLEPGYFHSAEVVHLPLPIKSSELRTIDLENGNIVAFPKRRS